MIKTNDWKKSGTSNHGDETRYTAKGGWFMSYTRSRNEITVRAPDGTFRIIEQEEQITSATDAKRLAAEYANKLGT